MIRIDRLNLIIWTLFATLICVLAWWAYPSIGNKGLFALVMAIVITFLAIHPTNDTDTKPRPRKDQAIV